MSRHTRPLPRPALALVLTITLMLALALPPTGPAAASAIHGTAPASAVPGPAGPDTADADADADETGDGPDHLVAMGAIDPAVPNPTGGVLGDNRTDRFEYTSYFPNHLRVHRGDVVEFRRDGFHSFTYTPPGEPRLRTFRADEVEGVVAFDAEPLRVDCGRGADGGVEGLFAREAQPPCPFTGEDTIDSAEYGITLAIDAPVGTYAYYCRIHGGMTGTIEVIPDEEEADDPIQVEAARRAAVAADTAAGEALITAGAEAESEVVGDHVRWTVKAGDVTTDGRVAVLRYLPEQLTIAPGDEVVFTVPTGHDAPPGGELVSEFHTVTFPSGVVQDEAELAAYFQPTCDPDGPDTGAPGVPSATALLGWCPDGMVVEFLLSPNAYDAPTRAPGGVVLPGVVHDSGFMTADGTPCRTACDPWDGQRMPATFDAAFPAEGEFGYVCLFHDDKVMSGTIRVEG